MGVTPIEYGQKKIRRYYRVRIGSFTLDQLYAYINSKNFGKIPKIWQEEDMTFYKYPDQPLLVIKDGDIFTTKETWEGEDFTPNKIRQQASILMRILNGAGFATYNRVTVKKNKFTPRKYLPYSTLYCRKTHEDKT